MTKISEATTLTSIVGTEVAPVYKAGQAAGDKFVMPMNLIGPNRITSEIYSAGVAYATYQNIVGPASNNKPIEILNIGYDTTGSDDIHQNLTGVVRLNGRLLLTRNMQWDTANDKWLTPLKGATAYGSACLEVGGEATILHATPQGVDFSDVPHEILMASANGTDGETNHRITSGYYTQSKAPFFARFNSTAYNPTTTANCWNQTSGVDPLLWLSTGETKTAENELARFEANGSNAAIFPAVYFAKSQGTLAVRTAQATSTITGRIGFKAYDGDEYHITACIDGVVRGTVANNSIGQSIRFLTSATTEAGLSTKLEITNDGLIKQYVPFRYDISAITTIPDYSANGYTPALSSGTVMQVQAASTVNGGMIFQGFTVSGTASAIALWFRGIQGSTAPTAPTTLFQALKHNGTTNFGAIADTEIGFHFRNNATTLIEILGNGNTGFGVTTPTALVHVAASTTVRAGLRVTPGAAPTTGLQNGDIWIDDTAHTLHVRINGVTKTVTLT